MRNTSLAWILSSVLCSSTAHLALKIGALHLTVDRHWAVVALSVATNRWLVLGVALHAVALGLWVAGLKRVELSVAYPFLALGLVLVSIVSWAFLRESISPGRVMGMLLISCGVLIISQT